MTDEIEVLYIIKITLLSFLIYLLLWEEIK